MKALISPAEPYFSGSVELGKRIVQIEESDFPVAPPMFWVEVPSFVTTDYVWNSVDGFIEKVDTQAESDRILSVSRRQFFRALYLSNLLESVKEAILLAPIDVQIDFDTATTFFSNDPSLLFMAQSLGKSEQDVIDLFNLALTQ